MDLLTFSSASAFKACMRKYEYAYERLYRAVRPAEPLVFGTNGHLGAEGYWRARQRDAPPAERLAACLAAVPADMEPFGRAKLVELLVRYCPMWDARDVVVLGVEVRFEVPLVHPLTQAAHPVFKLGGKLDVHVYLPRLQVVAVVEHKFTTYDAKPGSAYRTRLAVDAQVDQYFVGSAAFGEPAQCVLYDVISKPATRPHKAVENPTMTKGKPATAGRPATKTKPAVPPKPAEPPRPCAGQRLVDETPAEYGARIGAMLDAAPEDYYQWVQVARDEAARLEFAMDVWQYAEFIALSRATGYFPRNVDSCFRFGSPCEFWGPCSKSDSLHNPNSFRRATSVHEELLVDVVAA